MAKPSEFQEIHQKLDQLIAYHKSSRRWAVVKWIISLLIFVALVGIPLYYSVNFFQNPKQYLEKYLEMPQIKEWQKQLEKMMKQFQR